MRRLRTLHGIGAPDHAAVGVPARTSRRLVALVATLGLLAVAACDSGPSGPGTMTAFASGASIGGAVLQVEGTGIRGFTARGTTRLYSAAVDGRDGTHRVILVTPTPGEMAFDIEVDDRGMEGPVVTVVSAANHDNLVVSASNVTVRVER